MGLTASRSRFACQVRIGDPVWIAYLIKGHELAEYVNPRLERDEEGHVLENLQSWRDGLHLPLPGKVPLLTLESLHVHGSRGMAGADGTVLLIVVLVVFLNAVPLFVLFHDGRDE